MVARCLFRVLVCGMWLLGACGAGAEVGEACDTTDDCDNPDPPDPHSECSQLTCIEGACSKAGNVGVTCNGGTCDSNGECIP